MVAGNTATRRNVGWWIVLGGGALLIAALAVAFLAPGRGTRPAPVGTEEPAGALTDEGRERRLVSEDGRPVPAAASEEAYDRLTLIVESGDEPALQTMLATGEALMLPSGTQCRLIDLDFTASLVQILDGPYAGRQCYVPTEVIEPE